MARPSKKLNLSDAELTRVNEVLDENEPSTQKFRRAYILLMDHEGISYSGIVDCAGVSLATISNVKRKYFERGLEYALAELPRSGAPIRISPQEKDAIILLAGTPPPEGRACWSTRLLAEKALEYGLVKRISHNQIAIILKNYGLRLV